jgi:hypothetical protein
MAGPPTLPHPQPTHKARREKGMKNCHAPDDQTVRLILSRACATVLAVAFTVLLPQAAHADRVTPPSVPSDIQVPEGYRAFREGFAVGTQNYICLPSGSGFAWTFFGPQATLFNHDDHQVITHFLSPNPIESGTPRATWQHSQDTSTVWAVAIASSSDVAFVAPGAIPWLLLEVIGAQDGPTGGHKLTATILIQRLNTSGGVVPSTGCTLSTDVGKRALVPYTADYFFYKARGGVGDDN